MARSEPRPLARSDDLLTQELDGELLVYDRVSHDAHSLDATAAGLWRACDGSRTLDELATVVGVEREGVVEALAVLEERGLLAEPLGLPEPVSRRAVLRGGLIAGGAIAIGVPVIRSVLVPSAAGAQSPGPCTPNGDECTSSAQCCSGNCLDYGSGEGFCT